MLEKQFSNNRRAVRKKNIIILFDRGCFYVLATEASQKMSKKLKGYWMKSRSFLLKCFNDKEPRKDIEHTNFHSMKKIFEKEFMIKLVKDTVYQGTLNSPPKASFVVMRKR